MADGIWEHLKPRQAAVESALKAAIQNAAAGSPPILAEAMSYSLLALGKRLRPMLCILACEACGGTVEQALSAACAVEMIHAYSLIHDDLPAMDDDDLRRGLPTCHIKYGEALAILAGDALQAMAFETICTGYEPKTAAVMCLELATGSGAVGMVGGQVLDLIADGRISKDPTPQPPPRSGEGESDFNPPRFGEGGSRSEPGGVKLACGKSELEAIHALKTGALFHRALRLGKLAAMGGSDSGNELDAYADSFGLLFQVTDDLLDVESTTEATGKRVNKDADRGKLTYPGLIGVEASRAKAKELADEAVRAANTFGERGWALAELARFVLHRDR